MPATPTNFVAWCFGWVKNDDATTPLTRVADVDDATSPSPPDEKAVPPGALPLARQRGAAC